MMTNLLSSLKYQVFGLVTNVLIMSLNIMKNIFDINRNGLNKITRSYLPHLLHLLYLSHLSHLSHLAYLSLLLQLS